MSLLKKINLFVSFFLAFAAANSQTLSPSSVPQMFNGRYYQFRSYVQVDSALMLPARDTNVRTIHPAVVYRSQDSALYYFDKVRWRKVGSGSYVETDPTVGLHIKALTAQDTANFKMAARKYPVALVYDSATKRLNLTLNDNSVLFDTITVAGAGGDNWGSQVVIRQTSLTGNGTTGNPLGVDTFRISTNLRLKKVIDSLNISGAGQADGNNYPTAIDFSSSVLTLGRNNLPALLTIINTTSVGEGVNQYFTTARARSSLSAGTGIGYNSTTGVISNTSPDVPVSLTPGANVSVSGTYPNFTISASGGSGESNTASNLGASGVSLFAQKSGVDLQFRKLVAGTNVTLTQNANDITISASSGGSGGEINTASNLATTGARVFAQKSGVDLQFRRLNASTGLSVSESGDSIVLTNTAPNQPVSITAGSNIGVTGPYPNFVISSTGEANTGSNLGSSGGRVFAQKLGVDLQFRRLIGGTGLSVTENTNDITVVNTAPDQPVTITAGANTTVTGGYPNFTISSSPPASTNLYNSNGTVTSNRTITGANRTLSAVNFSNITWGANNDSSGAITTVDISNPEDPIWEARAYRNLYSFIFNPHLHALKITKAGFDFNTAAISNLGGVTMYTRFRVDSSGRLFMYNNPVPNNTENNFIVRDASTGELVTRNVSSFPLANIYNSNGTLTGDRTVTMGSFTLNFTSPVQINSHTIGRGGTGNGTNVKVGLNALDSNTVSGNNNTAMGQNAGAGLSGGNSSSFFGHNAGRYSKGDNNTYIGRGVASVFAQTTASARNTAVGEFALGRITTGDDNNAFGSNALTNLRSGNDNTVIGSYGMTTLTTGSRNTALGTLAAATNNGDNNVYLGYATGYFHKGNGNLFIGYQAGYSLDSSDNRLVIHNNGDADPLLYGDFTTDTLRINGLLTVRDNPPEGDSSTKVPSTSWIKRNISSVGSGGGTGTVLSVGLSAGSSGTDINVSGSPVTTSGTFTINIPDAGAGSRGVVTTGAQTFAGQKNFNSNVQVDGTILASQSGVRFSETASASAPSAGLGVLYAKTDKKLYYKNSDGTDFDLTAIGTSGSGENNTASNIGAGSGLFAQKSGVDLQFKTIKAGTGVSLSSTSNELTIASSGEANTASNLGTGASVFAQKSGEDLQFKSIKAGTNVSISATSSEVTISASSSNGVVAEKAIISPATFWGPAYGASPNNFPFNQILKVGASANDFKTITMNIVYFIPASSFPGTGQWVQIGSISDATYRPSNSVHVSVASRIDATKYTNFAGTAFSGSADYDKATVRIDANGQVFVYIGSISSYPQLSGSNILVLPIHVTYFIGPNT